MAIPRAAIAFACGVAALHLATRMPPLWLGAALASLLLILAWPLAWLRLPAVAALGVLWAQLQAVALLGDPFPDAMARLPLVVEGRIASIPARTGLATRFLLDVDPAPQSIGDRHLEGLVRLSWYGEPPSLHVGERWRLPVRLKPPHGYANPGVFDYERWLFAQGVRATGTVDRRRVAERLSAGPGRYWLDAWRQRLAERLTEVLGDAPATGLIRALVLGDRSGLAREQWELLTLTGTNHLVAISGLHIALVAAAALLLVRRLWSLSAVLARRLAAPRAAAVAAALAALGYAGLAGFAISTQRALVMLAVVLGAVWWQRTLRPFHALALALLVVLVLDPRAVLAYGFWLSFGAVALLLLAMGQRLPSRSLWTRWGRAQWVVALGLLPLLLLFFGRASLIAPLVNLVAVPLFSLVLLPLVLVSWLASLVPGLEWPLVQTARLLSGCLDVLQWAATLPWAAYRISARPSWAWALSLLGVLLFLAPRGLPGRWIGLVLLLPLLVLRPPIPGKGEAWVSLLDVGQGLALIVRTAVGTLVYDTGPAYPGGFDTGTAVLVPVLRWQGVEHVDRLLVSHADRDHAGGLSGLIERIPVGELISGEPAELDVPGARACRAGDAWDWGGVAFRILHPAAGEVAEGNDASCVLRIDTGGGSLLLTGDIGAAVERDLVERFGAKLRSDVLVAGHHGSATSSSAAFLKAVAPEWVLFSCGYANRFGFPARQVRERVARLGASALSTAEHGAIELRLGPEGLVGEPRGWRDRAGRLWTHRPARVPD